MARTPVPTDIWSLALDGLEGRLSSEEINRWLEPLELVLDGGDGLCTLLAPNRFFVDWVRDNYLDLIGAVLSRTLERQVRPELAIRPPDMVRQAPLSKEETASVKGEGAKPAPADLKNQEANLEPVSDSSSEDHKIEDRQIIGPGRRYVFDSFVVGEFNRFAYAAAQAVAGRPGLTYNPLFIYGGAGLGKTHLMNAIGNHIIDTRSPAKVVYISSEEFTNQMIQGIRNKTMDRFRNRYRNVDALLIDDIHFLGTKERTQEEFFFTFNALYNAGRQIVLTSDQRPKDIPGLEERLRSRFEWGLIADIQPPDKETKVAIIQKKAEEEGLSLPEDVAHLLASTEETNIRVLEGYLNRLAAFSSLTRRPISVDLARQALDDALVDKEISPEAIIRLVSERFNVRLVDMKSAKKEKKIAEPRQIAMYLTRQLTDLPLVKVGQKFGGKDHSTVVHAVKKISAKIDKDFDFRQEMANLEKTIRRNS